MSIVFLLRSFEFGGAERQLVVLATALHARGHQVTVIPFYARGHLAEDLGRAGVRVVPVGKRGRWDVVGFALRLWTVLRAERPDVLHGYTDVPNIVATLLRPFLPGTTLVWGVRASDMDKGTYGRLAAHAFRLSSYLSRFADLIIANSRHGAAYHAGLGYPSQRIRVIPNGIDSERFAPRAADRARLRSEWGIKQGEILVGLVGRLDPVKDHGTFLRAAAVVKNRRPEVRFICIGDGPEQLRTELEQLAESLALRDHLQWSPGRADVGAVYNALDILCSASLSEAFSNVIGEAMASGVPCVVTRAGDSPWIVEGTGEVVPIGSPIELADGIDRLAARLSPELSAACRKRIVTRFSIDRLATDTLAALAAARAGS